MLHKSPGVGPVLATEALFDQIWLDNIRLFYGFIPLWF